MLLTTKGHFLPYLSAAKPKVIAPTDLNINTSVIPQVISVFETPKSAAKSLTVKLTVKKSKASHDYLGSAIVLQCGQGTYPSDKTNEEESPLTLVKHHNQLEGIWRLIHWRP